MPFIWNDSKWQFIGEDEEYNSEEFVIVRKLGIEFQHKDKTQHSEESIRLAFNKYGPIESVEMLSSSIGGGKRTRSKKKPEAYVTFVHNKDAYFAMIDNKSESKFIVSPAAKSHQPKTTPAVAMDILSDGEDPMNSPISLQTLNNDYLIKIFQHCDVESLVQLTEVCRSFKETIRTHLFPKVKEFDFNSYEKRNMTATTLCKILRCIGPYVTELRFTRLNAHINPNIFFQMLAKYVGTNLRELHLTCIKLTNSSMRVIKAVLKQLHTLSYEYYTEFNERYEKIDLQTFCPNLVCLVLFVHGTGLVEHENPWSSLEELSIDSFMRTYLFAPFATQNPQLKRLHCMQKDDEHSKLDLIVKCFPNLEKLSIFQEEPLNDLMNLLLLKRLKSLTNLRLEDIEVLDENKLTAFLRCFTELKELREIKLNIYFSEEKENNPGHAHKKIQNAIMELARKLPHLKIFYFNGYAVDQSTVMNFIRSAKQLKQFGVDKFKNAMTEQFVKDIVRARKANPPLAAEQVEPLYLSFHGVGEEDEEEEDEEEDEENIENAELVKELLKDDEVKRYITVL